MGYMFTLSLCYTLGAKKHPNTSYLGVNPTYILHFNFFVLLYYSLVRFLISAEEGTPKTSRHMFNKTKNQLLQTSSVKVLYMYYY